MSIYKKIKNKKNFFSFKSKGFFKSGGGSSHSHNQGFTLLEVMLAISITIVLFFSIVEIYEYSSQTYSQTDTKAEMSQNGRVILDRMIREIRQTNDIVTELPEDASDPPSLPDEIMFQDGHDTTDIRYIRYYLDNSNIKRQQIVYYFDSEPSTYVYWHATDQESNPPTMEILEDRIIGEYVDDIEFWGEQLISINLYLLKDAQTETIFTSVYGRNL